MGLALLHPFLGLTKHTSKNTASQFTQGDLGFVFLQGFPNDAKPLIRTANPHTRTVAVEIGTLDTKQRETEVQPEDSWESSDGNDASARSQW